MSKDYESVMKRKYEWSIKQFGKGYSPEGILDHMEKEIAEVRAQPTDLEEWIDLMFLSTDGAHRLVKATYPKATPDEVVAVVRSAFEQKLRININRKWGERVPGKAIEHVRDINSEKFSMDKVMEDFPSLALSFAS